MKIISEFKDYYDYIAAAFGTGAQDEGYKEKVYLRKPALKIAATDLKPASCWALRHKNRFISKWWSSNAQTFSLSEVPGGVRGGCIFVCGKAFPFLFTRGVAGKTVNNKTGGIAMSRVFNEAMADSIAGELSKAHKGKAFCSDTDYNFFKTYFSYEEFIADVAIERDEDDGCWRPIRPGDYRDIRAFFDFYADKDFTELLIRLDCPLAVTIFLRKGKNEGFEFVLNPNLNEFGFMRMSPAHIMYQELELFVGNVLVKDLMPFSYQSDLDKLTARGFDPKISFRKK
ncbi:MAG: hypothetical protein FWD58_08310 [Firmicutes bacterium]|nr:hypothetical protein [Bacillota bacterium]